jgi:hypothetical protein
MFALLCAPEVEHLDTSEIICVCKSAMEASPDDDGWLSLFGLAYYTRFSQTCDLSDLDRAISAGCRGLELTPRTHQGAWDREYLITEMLSARFDATGCPHDLENATAARQGSVIPGAAKVKNNSKPVVNLLAWLKIHTESFPYFSRAEEALSITQRAVKILPQTHPALTRLFNIVGTWFLEHSKLEGCRADVDAAVIYFNATIELAPPDSVDLPLYSRNLAESLLIRDRFYRGEITDSSRPHGPGTVHTRDCDKDKRAIPRPLQQGIDLCARFRRHQNISLLAEGVSQIYDSMDLVPDGYPAFSQTVQVTILAYASWFSVTQDLAQLPGAIEACSRLLGITDGESINLPAIHFGMGVLQEHRCWTSEKPFSHGINEAIFHFKAGALCASGSQTDRLEASLAWAQLSNRHYPRSLDTLRAFDTTLELVGGLDGHQPIFRGNYVQLRELSELPVQAAAAACRMDSPQKAIEWLERGRCLVWSHVSRLQAPLTQTDEHIFPLNDVVQQQTCRLNASQLPFDKFLSKMASLEDESWEKETRTLRAIPPFDAFGTPPVWSSVLENLPEQGPVVVINLCEDRCDAFGLLLGLNEPLHIPLPCFTLEKARKYRSEMKVQLNIRGLRAQEEEVAETETVERGAGPYRRKRSHSDSNILRRILRCLWVELVKPVLDMLAIFVSTASKSTLILG